MNPRHRFAETMSFGRPDRVPYFEEGLRPEVLEAWRRQGMPADLDPAAVFPSDPREEVQPDLDPRPRPETWPASREGLADLVRRLDPDDPSRLSDDLDAVAARAEDGRQVTMLRVHRGFFLSMGVYDWDRLHETCLLLYDDPVFVRELLEIQGRFAARVAERVLERAPVDAAIVSEPIGGNEGPLISPRMYEELILPSYRPVLDVVARHGVRTLIFRTYANARLLLPAALRAGFTCLWACEVDPRVMDYRQLRREMGPDLRLIGGIDLDALRHGPEAIRREVESKVPPLLEQGGYVPLADGRVREDVPWRDYLAYREMLGEMIGRYGS